MGEKREKILFPNYQEIPRRISISLWQKIRVLSVSFAVFLGIGLLFFKPLLFVIWGIIFPLLPLLFFLAPGLWRNICPLAAVNQFPRLLGWTRAWTLPPWAKNYAYVIGIALFFTLVSLRKVFFNNSPEATAVLILSALAFAFVGGLFFKGKSGWCSTFCPLLPVQRVYGQNPFLLVPNSHCQPCVGCVKNCYDFNPKVAYLADMYDDDKRYSAYRRFFASAFPGFVLGYFLIPNPPEIAILNMYVRFVVSILLSVGLFNFFEVFLKVSTVKVTSFFGISALNIYYWFSFSSLLSNVEPYIGSVMVQGLSWSLKLVLVGFSLVWIIRNALNEKAFLSLVSQTPATVVSQSTLKILQKKSAEKDKAEVEFEQGGVKILADINRTLLDVAKGAGVAIEEGCRVGMCGSDPVTIVDGMDQLSPIGDEEKSTLQRLGLGERCRMACSARVLGNVRISLRPEFSKVQRVEAYAEPSDTSIKTVVIIGNGIAGITSADFVRRLHSNCKIILIGDERYNFYKRLAITQLIFGKKGMGELYLLPEEWYDEHKINCWLNTRVVAIHPNEKCIQIGANEKVEYDRLILAMGSHSHLPSNLHTDFQGVFVVRGADDAMAIRSYTQENGVNQAVVVGAGSLGLETGFALSKIGLKVCILERGLWIMNRQLDQQAANILSSFLIGLGINIVTQTTVAELESEGRVVKGIKLQDGRKIDCEAVVICAGVEPNISLAIEAGIRVNRGVIVDKSMRTNLSDIFAAGDVAEYRGKSTSLWSTAVEQGRIAALSAVGKEAYYEGDTNIVILKIAGIDVVSMGTVDLQDSGGEEIVHAEIGSYRYAKILLKGSTIVGSILIGYPEYFPIIAKLIKNKIDISQFLPRLREHEWQVLGDVQKASI